MYKEEYRCGLPCSLDERSCINFLVIEMVRVVKTKLTKRWMNFQIIRTKLVAIQ